jgi:hypothetical protein
MDSDQGPWPVLAEQATADGTHLPVSCLPQAGRTPQASWMGWMGWMAG